MREADLASKKRRGPPRELVQRLSVAMWREALQAEQGYEGKQQAHLPLVQPPARLDLAVSMLNLKHRLRTAVK